MKKHITALLLTAALCGLLLVCGSPPGSIDYNIYTVY